MTTPVTLDLPSDTQLFAAADPNPTREAARLTDTANPDRIRELATRFITAGADTDQLYSRSTRTQQLLGAGFTNNGNPVYDRTTHLTQLPPGFRDAGTRLHDTGRRLAVVADELDAAQRDTTRALEQLSTELARQRAAYTAEINAAHTGGQLPADALPALQARRDTVAATMLATVLTCGRVVADRITRYAQTLDSCRRSIDTDPTAAGPAPLAAALPNTTDTSGTRLDPLLGGRFETSTPAPPTPPTPGFTPTPQGPSIEVQPLPPPLAGPLATPPAPNLGVGQQDGPGSGQLAGQPGPHIDTARPSGRKNSGSLNQGQKEIERGHAPPGIERIDRGRVPGEKPHVHFDDGGALNQDGTWKHLPAHQLTGAQRKFLEKYGWTVPQ